MPDKGLISVVIPNYNQTHYVGGAIQSVLAQTWRDFEIIVVDDGSTDNSRAVVGGFGKQVRYIWQENQGLAGARNTGIHAARGEYIALLDADDLWEPTFLEQMMELAARRPEAVVYYCQARCIDSNGDDLPQILGGPVIPPEQMHEQLLRANFLIPSTIVMRRSVVMDAGLFDPTLRSCEDWDLWLRLLPHHTFAGSSECLVRYRQHGTSLSANLTGMHSAHKAVIRKHFGLDDGQPQRWSAAKRRAYGGFHRYYALTFVLRQNNWQDAGASLQRALRTDPTLAVDIDLFYDLALGAQPVGMRGTADGLALKANERQIVQLLTNLSDAAETDKTQRLRRTTLGTAYAALGLVAYNTGQIAASRRYLAKALIYRPGLRHESRVVGDLIKSCLGRPLLNTLRKLA